jgi:hypothetical protein
MTRFRRVVLRVALPLLALTVGCAFWKATRPLVEPPPPSITPTRIEYVDADGFDTLLESALVNQDPAIIIQTRNEKPDWGDRLNAWIAAWNMGGKVVGGAVRMQAPFVPEVVVDGDSIREFRLLVESLMGRLGDQTRQGLAWLAEEKTRGRRVRLLKPYNLRFHMDEDGFIQIVLFNGRYAEYHREFVRALAGRDTGEEWDRTYFCSRCAERRKRESGHQGPGMKLTSGGTTGP